MARPRLPKPFDTPNFGICLTLVLVHAFAAIGLPAPRTVHGASACHARGCKCGATAHAIDDCCCSAPASIRNDYRTKPSDSSGSCCKSKKSLTAAWEASKCRSATLDSVISHAPTVRPYEPLETIRLAIADKPVMHASNPRSEFAPPPVPPPKSV